MGIFVCFSSPAKADSEARQKRGLRRFFVPRKLSSWVSNTACLGGKRLLAGKTAADTSRLHFSAATHTSAFSRRECVRGVQELSAFPMEGRGECRVPTHPQPRMQSKKAYELVTTGKPDDPAFPHAVVLTVSFVISPVIGLCCHRRFACAKLVASVEASGPHDFAVRVQHRSSKVPNSVHRIPPRVRDDRERPLVGRDSAIRTVFCLVLEARYFCAEGWTGVLRN